MYRCVLILALSGAAAACATTQEKIAEKERECVTQPEEATGTRVESQTVCRQAPGDESAE
jgi:hypothetical protein